MAGIFSGQAAVNRSQGQRAGLHGFRWLTGGILERDSHMARIELGEDLSQDILTLDVRGASPHDMFVGLKNEIDSALTAYKGIQKNLRREFPCPTEGCLGVFNYQTPEKMQSRADVPSRRCARSAWPLLRSGDYCTVSMLAPLRTSRRSFRRSRTTFSVSARRQTDPCRSSSFYFHKTTRIFAD